MLGSVSRLHPATLLALCALGSCLPACIPIAIDGGDPDLTGKTVRVTFLHTSDIHARTFPYNFDPSFTDNGLGLEDEVGPYGGLARMATILKEQRAKSGRVLHLDSGDSFQGSVTFNYFDGEAEFRALSAMGLDGAVIANHEFDDGAVNLADQAVQWATFPLLAANYQWEDPAEPWASALGQIAQPTAMYDLDGFRIGVIGMANFSSLNSIDEENNSLGIKTIDEGDVIPHYSELLRAQGADIIVLLSHMGVTEDEYLAETYPQIDLILGGHNHVALDPPIVITNAVTGKRIPLVDSGAFAKFVGRLDIAVRDGEILSTSYSLFPIDGNVADDPEITGLLQEYQDLLDDELNTSQVLGYAESQLNRYGTTGGDSMLGNFTAEAMRAFPGVETEIALTNTLGIRSDVPAGNITIDTLFNTMPFDNTITTMFLSGREVQETLDFSTARSSERGCQSQIQVAGIAFTMDCNAQVASDILINGVPLEENGVYEMATNNYIAHGGSGFEVLQRNTTQVDTGISIRDVVQNEIILRSTLPQAGVASEDGRINAVY
ncbi:MAG: bifunctional metallophosphatase/5'-nucleotidase [Myxococcales bacterium]|nr:bifunctional metallophosphatase/5'-nucleotidase [Myxococcales bacterium]